MHRILASLCLAAATAIAAPASAATVTVDLSLMPVTADRTPIETASPGFGGVGPVTLDWDPDNSPTTQILFWNDTFSRDDAGYCSQSTIQCPVELRVASGFQLTFDSFSLGGWPDTGRTIAWNVIDLATNLSILSGSENVLGTVPSTLSVGGTSTIGFRLLFGPDGFNGGVTGLTYTYNAITSTPIPLPAGGLLLLTGLGALAALRRRRA